MQKSLKQNVKIARIKGKALSLQESHKKAEVKESWCSDFNTSLNLLAEGECWNPDIKSQKAKVIITDLKTGRFKGNFTTLLL